jgi:hypothetical protein
MFRKTGRSSPFLGRPSRRVKLTRRSADEPVQELLKANPSRGGDAKPEVSLRGARWLGCQRWIEDRCGAEVPELSFTLFARKWGVVLLVALVAALALVVSLRSAVRTGGPETARSSWSAQTQMASAQRSSWS